MFRRLALPLAGLVLAGCGQEPGAALFTPSPDPVAVDPADVRAVDEEGFPNVLVTPAAVPGTWRPPERVAADERDLAVRGARVEGAAAAAERRPSFAPALRQRAATHVEETRRAIEGRGAAAGR
jgi:hypothetical protein